MKQNIISFIRSFFAMALFVVAFLFVGGISSADAALTDHFVTTWKTDNAGVSNSTSILLPTTGGGYNYDVDWDNDGTFDEFGITGSATHDFGAAGTYTIRIQGSFPRMFFGNSGDKEKILSIDQWGTGAWTSFYQAYFGASNLVINATDVPDLSGVTTMYQAFAFTDNIGTGSSTWAWDVSNVQDFTQMFYTATAFNKDISAWNTSSATTFSAMFHTATSFNQNISGWNTTNVTNMSQMFEFNTAFNQPLNGWDVSNVTNMRQMFRRATTFNQDLNLWVTSSLTDMYYMFEGATAFNGNVTTWDVADVTNMERAFAFAPAFNQDISGWTTTSLTNLKETFYGASVFNQPIGSWNTANVTTLWGTFHLASAFNQSLNTWNVNNVTTFYQTFRYASAFNQPLNLWNTTGVTSLFQTFEGAIAFDQDISGWDMGDVTSMYQSFRNTTFNQDISGWDTGMVTTMQWMFLGPTSFDQNIGSWDVSSVTNMFGMFQNSELSVTNYDALLNGWDTQTLQSGVNFNGGTSKYCLGSTARTNIDTGDSWTISDGGIDCQPAISITAPTKLDNGSITDTTIQVTDLLGINAANVTVNGATTATTSSFACVQTTATQVDCTISIDTSGNLTIGMTNTSGQSITQTETNYFVDTTGPVPTMTIDTSGGVNTPTITFSATDDVAVDYFEITYNTDNGAGGVGAPTTDSPVTSPVVLTLDPDEALHTITLRVYDTAGNFTDISSTFPPIVNFTVPTPINNATITDATVTVTSPAGNDLDNIIVSSGSATIGTCTGFGGDTVSPYANPVTCTMNVTATGAVTVDARDSANLAVGDSTTSFIIETTNPVAAVTAPTKTSNGAITNTTIVVTDNTAINAADVSVSAVNTTGTFSVSGLACVQTNSTQVDCTLQIDGNEGTGDLRVSYTDVAGNATSTDEAGYTIDQTAPGTPVAAPDLQTASDTGSSTTDDVTNNGGPSFDVVCTEVGSTITLYSDNPAANTNVGTHTCTAVATETATAVLGADGVYNITYTEADALGNESAQSPALAVTLDTDAPNTAVVSAISSDTGSASNDFVTNDQTLVFTGSSENNATVELFLDGASIGTTTADGSGNWTYDYTGTTITAGFNYALTNRVTDVAGNTGAISSSRSLVIDIIAPGAPGTPDLQAASDSGSSTTDNITSDNTPSFDVVCTELSSTITLYSDNPAANTNVGSVFCNSIATKTLTTGTLNDGTHNLTAAQVDLAGNASTQSAALTVEIDTAMTTPTLGSITSDSGSSSTDYITNDQTLIFTGTAEANSSVELFIDAVSITTVTANGSGAWTYDYTGTTLAGGATYAITGTSIDTAGNSASFAAQNVTIDIITPATPVAPDLQTASDSGSSTTDNITSDNTPSFDVGCTEVGLTVTLYSDNPAANTAIGTHTCTAIATETATVSPAIVDGTHTISYSQTDVAGNESVQSTSLVVEIDTGIVATTISTPSNGSPVSGTAEANSNVVVTTPSGATCTVTADGTGAYSCTLAPSAVDGENVTATATDAAGNTSPVTVVGGIDISAPTSPTIDTITSGDTTITGTGEIGTTMSFDILTCGNAPVVVDGTGVWTCTGATPAPSSGSTLVATSTDAGGNTSSASFSLPSPRSGGGGSRSSKSDTETVVTIENPFDEEELCPASQLLTQNLKAPSRNGEFDLYTGDIVREARILQGHMNRLGFNSGPVDGIIGPLTDGAIKRMQVFLGTTPDGLVGPLTRALINNSCGEGGISTTTQLSTSVTETTQTLTPTETPEIPETVNCAIAYTRLVRRGIRGDDVRHVQTCMNSLGYSTGIVDGIYGTNTFAGVTAYQRAQNLQKIDGIVGPETAGSLNALSGLALDGVTPLN